MSASQQAFSEMGHIEGLISMVKYVLYEITRSGK